MFDLFLPKTQYHQARIGGFLIDQRFDVYILLFRDDFYVFGCNGQPSCLHQLFHSSFCLIDFAGFTGFKYLDIGPVPVGMAQDDKTQHDHQVGIFGIDAPNPYMDPVLKDNLP